MASPRRWPWLIAAAGLLAAAQVLSARIFVSPWPPYAGPVLQEHALTDVSALLLGQRRVGADLGLIQMFQYYARPEAGGGEAGHGDEDGHAHDGHRHEGFLSSGEKTADQTPGVQLGDFPKLKEHIFRVFTLDPYFHYAVLFGAGALAFNLNRDDEALALLSRGAAVDPTFWRYRLYAGAIAYRKNNQVDKIIPLLEEALKYPDCPGLLQNILGNIYIKRGDIARAAAVYTHMLRTNRDPAYRDTAREKLERFRAQGQLPALP